MIENRIQSLFKTKKTDVLTIYFTAGYPSLNDTESIILELDKNGVDLIEIGMPYSDPLADGPTIQASSTLALKNGMNLSLMFKQLEDIRTKTQIPLVLMGYYNQVIQYGVERFCESASQVGIDGLILPDLPLDEYLSSCKEIFDQYGLTNTLLVTPTSSDQRIKEIDKTCSGFLYAVSSHSITGGSLEADLESYGNRLKSLDLKNPVQIGFGISNRQSYLAANEASNGAIIGSAFIKAISQTENINESIKTFIQKIKTS